MLPCFVYIYCKQRISGFYLTLCQQSTLLVILNSVHRIGEHSDGALAVR